MATQTPEVVALTKALTEGGLGLIGANLFSSNPAEQALARDVILGNPDLVMQQLQTYSSEKAFEKVLSDEEKAAGKKNPSSLTRKGQADIAEFVLGHLTDEKAAEMLQSHLTPDRVTELLRARGDLPSVAANVANVEMLQAVLVEELASEHYGASFMAYVWAIKLHDHPEYEELLKTSLVKGTFEEYVVMGAYLMASDSLPEGGPDKSDHTGHFEVDRNDDRDDDDDDDDGFAGIFALILEAVQIDIDEANVCLNAMFDRGFDPDDIDWEAVAEARDAINKRHQSLEEAPQVVAAEEAADDLDF